MNRRKLIHTLFATPLVAGLGTSFGLPNSQPNKLVSCSKLRISLNAYSFNEVLQSGDMKLEELLEYCERVGFDAIDITGYYFPGYPEVPTDDYLYTIKRQAFLRGLDISGTGVRTDFTDPDPEKRRQDIELVKRWVVAAEKLGAPVLRIFAGHQEPEGYSREEMFNWVVPDIQACVEHGKRHGVVVAVQNHNGFLKTADQVEKLLAAVNSEWTGLILDTGSFRQGDPYEEIAQVIPHAVSWQVKETIYVEQEPEPIDLEKLLSIIRALCFSGYLPIETLGPGDPRAKVAVFLDKVRKAMNSY